MCELIVQYNLINLPLDIRVNRKKKSSNLKFEWFFKFLNFFKKMGKKKFFFEIFSKNSEKILKDPKNIYFYTFKIFTLSIKYLILGYFVN